MQQQKRRIILPFPVVMLAILLVSCASHPVSDVVSDGRQIPAAKYIPAFFNWQTVCTGISRFDFEYRKMPVRYHAVRIDLDTPGLQIVAYPDPNTIKKIGTTKKTVLQQPFIFRGMRTQAFARKYNCIVAMNATPFAGQDGKWNLAAKLGDIRQLTGIHTVNGLQISPPSSNYCALVFTGNKDTAPRVAIIDSQTQETLSGYPYAFGGFFTILRNGVKRKFTVTTYDSRSGAGIGDNGRILYLLVVEGEIPEKSAGLSYPQCADIFAAMGCSDAMEFDGGSSSQLSISGRSVLSYFFTVVEGNSFGFYISNTDFKK
jgi:exopolysaccharide biosynthesis protein